MYLPVPFCLMFEFIGGKKCNAKLIHVLFNSEGSWRVFGNARGVRGSAP